MYLISKSSKTDEGKKAAQPWVYESKLQYQ